MTAAPTGLVSSQRELARRLGLSHTALQKAQAAGRIAPEPDGSWNVETVRARLTASSDPARRGVPAATPSRAAPHAPGPPPEPPPAGGTSFHSARTANEVLKAQERKLRLEERRGQLVDKARALLLVRRLAQEERDAVLAWPPRVAAEIAAELGVDPHRLQTALETRLRAHLAERHASRVTVT
jgi:hypothetical protein